MNRILYKRSFLFLLTFTLICWSIYPCFGRSAKPPTQPCANCHTGAAGSGSINIISLPLKYQIGEEYQIDVSISHTGQKRWGCKQEMVLPTQQVISAASTITLRLVSVILPILRQGRSRGQSNSANWDLKWTAPDSRSQLK